MRVFLGARLDSAPGMRYSDSVIKDERSFFLTSIGKSKWEVETMRTRITLACTDCKQRNYNTTKDKKTHPDRMEVKKYCRFCKTHTTHKETK